MLSRNLRLIERGGVDQIPDRFGLRQIEASMQIGTQGELARLSQTRAGLDGLLNTMPQYNRRPMAGDFHQILGGVRFWGFEVSHHYLIDTRFQSRQVRTAILKPRAVQYRVSDVAGVLTG